MGAAEKLEPIASAGPDARAFLARLGSFIGADRFTFQTFDDGNAKHPGLSRVLHGNLSQLADTLAALNARGAGVFVMVNAGDGRARKADNVTAVRAVFVDLDGAPLEPVRIATPRPHLVVESSSGRWHAYWLTQGLPLDQFKPMQRALAQRFAADPKVCDLPRVMRLPGLLHQKGAPFLTRIVEQHTGPAYTQAELIEGLALASLVRSAPASVRKLPATIGEGARNSTLFDLACGLVRKGYDAAGVLKRLQMINAERCEPPLPANEVATIAANASAKGSQGFAMLPHVLLDSAQWAALAPVAKLIVVAAFRRYDGSNNGRIALAWPDFEGQRGFSRSATFYAHREQVTDAGILIQTADGTLTQSGKLPAFFAIAARFLPSPQGEESVTSAWGKKRALKYISS